MTFKKTLATICVAVIAVQGINVSAVETGMTQEAKQEVLDSLQKYEQTLTEFAASNTETVNVSSGSQPTHRGNRQSCTDEKSCSELRLKAEKERALQSMEYDDESNMLHQVKVYFVNDAPFASGYNDLSEYFFELKGEELEIFKDTVLYHYLGHEHKDMKAQLIATTEKIVGIKALLSTSKLNSLAQTDTRITRISHAGNTKRVQLKH